VDEGDEEGREDTLKMIVIAFAAILVVLLIVVVVVIPSLYSDKGCDSPFTVSTCTDSRITVACQGTGIAVEYQGRDDGRELANLSVKLDDMQPRFMGVTPGSRLVVVPEGPGQEQGHHLLVVTERTDGAILVEQDRMLKCG
jgi:hypothetical protein